MRWVNLAEQKIDLLLVNDVFFNSPGSFKYYLRCPLNSMSGFYCFGCGSTRALYELLHGEILRSMRQNIMFIPTMLTLLIMLKHQDLILNRRFQIIAGGVVVTYTILRNLPCDCFAILRPLS
ncbi:MAG: DUF2752 domain-containing protein [Victivallaceae bacterium]